MKTIVATTLGAAMALAAIVPASAGTIGDGYDKWTIYSDDTIACIEADAAAKLTPIQYTYLESIMDNHVNAYETWKANGLTLSDTVKVHTFVWAAGPDCVLKS
jgi:hypothetical protein